MRRLALAGLVSILGLAAGAGWIWYSFEKPGPSTVTRTVLIANGTHLRGIASQLADAEVIRRPWVFMVGVHVLRDGGRLQAGEFAIPPRASMAAVASHLASGETVQRRLAVPEGLTSGQVVDLVKAAEGLVGEAPAAYRYISLLPDTYFYSWGDSRAATLKRMETAMEQALQEAWRQRDVSIAIRSPQEALVLASIVEKETGRASERRRISAVYHNRLKKRWRLQADPTVIFALTGGKPLERALNRADLRVESPYNTYRRHGLPPGPIGNPGLASIRAATNPLQTDEYYFVADGEGGHRFARTLSEHNRNVREWRRVQRARQIPGHDH